MQYIHKNKTLIALWFLIIIASVFRIYNLNWGAPFYFHPDERNIIYSVTGLHIPNQFNPHFFAYGSLPIYTIYLISVILNVCVKLSQFIKPDASVFTVSFTQSLIVSRAISSFYSILLIPILFILGKKFNNTTSGIWAATLGTFSVGLIQFAHFGTFEMWLTFWGAVLCLTSLMILKSQKRRYYIFSSIVFGILISVKISSFALAPIPIFIIFYKKFFYEKQFTKSIIARLLGFIREIILFLVITAIVYVFTNPFVFLDTSDFLSSMHYEIGVAVGTEPVFYTGGFTNTKPVLFQFLSIYPFLLNPLITLLFILSFIYLLGFIIVKRRKIEWSLPVIFFAILFFSQSDLYVKWTRYMMPTLPFIYIALALFLTEIFQSIKKSIKIGMSVIIIAVCLLFAISYSITAFVEPDTRVQAALFAKNQIPTNAHIISEVYDLGILPFNNYFSNITLFNFYDLDNNSSASTPKVLAADLTNTNYIILPSQRIIKSRLLHKKTFPNGYSFYHNLISGKLGYRLIYKTPCDIFCQITYLGDPVYRYEETANVFDRPTVYIFAK